MPIELKVPQVGESITEVEIGEWVKQAKDWEALGATHLSVNSMRAGLATPKDHIEAIRKFKQAIG